MNDHDTIPELIAGFLVFLVCVALYVAACRGLI